MPQPLRFLNADLRFYFAAFIFLLSKLLSFALDGPGFVAELRPFKSDTHALSFFAPPPLFFARSPLLFSPAVPTRETASRRKIA